MKRFLISLVLLLWISTSQRTPINIGTEAAQQSPSTSTGQATLVSLPEKVLSSRLKALSGRPIKLSNYSGKVLVINLWATWCGPCRLETPELVKLYQQFRSQGVEIVGLSTEEPADSADSMRDWVRNYGVNYRIGWATQEVALALMQKIEAIPQTFVISHDGRILKRFVGFNHKNTPQQFEKAIRQALDERASARKKR